MTLPLITLLRNLEKRSRDSKKVPPLVATRAKLKAGRDAFVAEVKAMGKDYAVPQGNFVFFKTGMPIKDFIAKMRAEGVIVGRAFPPLLEWARVTIGLPHEMEVCHRAMRKVLG